jgi:hypothetical protein
VRGEAKTRYMKFTLAAGFIGYLAAVVLAGALISLFPGGITAPDNLARLGWLAILLLLVWGISLGGYTAALGSRPTGFVTVAVLSAAAVGTSVYALLSAVLMFTALVWTRVIDPGYHLTFQVVLGGFYLGYLALPIFSYQGGSQGLQEGADQAVRLRRLIADLSMLEREWRNSGTDQGLEIAREVKALRECLSYSLPSTGRALNDPSLSEILDTVRALVTRDPASVRSESIDAVDASCHFKRLVNELATQRTRVRSWAGGYR